MLCVYIFTQRLCLRGWLYEVDSKVKCAV